VAQSGVTPNEVERDPTERILRLCGLAMMIADPLFMRGSLMQVDDRCESGIDSDAVNQ
jgi:hypothetical protein